MFREIQRRQEELDERLRLLEAREAKLLVREERCEAQECEQVTLR